MILLDTNYLIRALVKGTKEADQVSGWLSNDEELCTSSIAWYEFLSGPVDHDGIDVMKGVVQSRILPFSNETAIEAAGLFNATGRMRNLRIDAMIAATAILSNSYLATSNVQDFRLFVPEGLQLL